MDEFLSDIYMDIFREYVKMQNKGYDMIEKEDRIIMETDQFDSYISFNENNIIELYVNNKIKDEMEFYLHFQMKNLKHAVDLFNEMKDAIDHIIETPQIRVLLCCSGGLTTSYFASKLNEAIELLDLDIQVSAIGYHKVFQEAQDYDVILLAPQVAYQLAQCESLLKDKSVKVIPGKIFAKYDVQGAIDLIMDAFNEKKQSDEEDVKAERSLYIEDMVLCISAYKNNHHINIDYFVYQELNALLDVHLIKNSIYEGDLYSIIDLVMLDYPAIKKIAISMPGIIDDGVVSSTFMVSESFNLKQVLEDKYQCEIILCNDVNSAALGYYVTQNEYESFAFLFQPNGLQAGVGSIVNGHLLTGKYHFAGEVKFLPLELTNSQEDLSITPEGTIELVYKILLSIISITSPEHIVLYSDLIEDKHVIEVMLEERIRPELSYYHVEINQIYNLQQYIYLGLLQLCIDDQT